MINNYLSNGIISYDQMQIYRNNFKQLLKNIYFEVIRFQSTYNQKSSMEMQIEEEYFDERENSYKDSLYDFYFGTNDDFMFFE